LRQEGPTTIQCAVDPIAVAHVESVLGAIPPDRVLHEPQEGLWKFHVEFLGIDLAGDGLNVTSSVKTSSSGGMRHGGFGRPCEKWTQRWRARPIPSSVLTLATPPWLFLR
jgi:hypothetical protein